MFILEYKARFQELPSYAITILPTKEEQTRCFVKDLRTQLRIET